MCDLAASTALANPAEHASTDRVEVRQDEQEPENAVTDLAEHTSTHCVEVQRDDPNTALPNLAEHTSTHRVEAQREQQVAITALTNLAEQTSTHRAEVQRDEQILNTEEWLKARAALVEALGDHEFYCSAYSSKEQPHVEGLLITLAQSLHRKEEDLAQAASQGEPTDALEHSRQLLHRLMSATNRRMHKGFPEMMTYLLNRPMEYSSHLFVPLFFDMPYRALTACFYRYISKKDMEDEVQKQHYAVNLKKYVCMDF